MAKRSVTLPVLENQKFEVPLKPGVKKYEVKTRRGVRVAFEVKGGRPVKLSARSGRGRKLRVSTLRRFAEPEFKKTPGPFRTVCIHIYIIDTETPFLDEAVIAEIHICVTF